MYESAMVSHQELPDREHRVEALRHVSATLRPVE